MILKNSYKLHLSTKYGQASYKLLLYKTYGQAVYKLFTNYLPIIYKVISTKVNFETSYLNQFT